MKITREDLGFQPQEVDEDEKKAIKKGVLTVEDALLTIAEEHHTDVSIRWINAVVRVVRRVTRVQSPEIAEFIADSLDRGSVPKLPQEGDQKALGAGDQGGEADRVAELERSLADATRKYQLLAQRVAGDVDDQGNALSAHDEYMKRAKTLHDNATTDVADVVPDPATYVEKSKLKPLIDAVVNEKTKLDAGLTSKAKEHKAGHLKNRTSLIVYTEADFDDSVVAVSATLDEKLKNLQEAAK
jgi:hypothetical protein